MKRVVAVLLSGMLLFVLCACEDNSYDEYESSSSYSSTDYSSGSSSYSSSDYDYDYDYDYDSSDKGYGYDESDPYYSSNDYNNDGYLTDEEFNAAFDDYLNDLYDAYGY
jgi:hypothetical protein